jgi:hypothetical protein
MSEENFSLAIDNSNIDPYNRSFREMVELVILAPVSEAFKTIVAAGESEKIKPLRSYFDEVMRGFRRHSDTTINVAEGLDVAFHMANRISEGLGFLEFHEIPHIGSLPHFIPRPQVEYLETQQEAEARLEAVKTEDRKKDVADWERFQREHPEQARWRLQCGTAPYIGRVHFYLPAERQYRTHNASIILSFSSELVEAYRKSNLATMYVDWKQPASVPELNRLLETETPNGLEVTGHIRSQKPGQNLQC